MPTREAESIKPTDQLPGYLFPPGVPAAVQRVVLQACMLLNKRCGSQLEYLKARLRMGECIREWNKVPKHPDYPQMFQQLQGELLGHGGNKVIIADSDYHLKAILEFGKVINPKAIRAFRGEPSRCHQNVAELYLAEKYEGAQIATGYGLSDDGIWRSHSWLVRGDEIIETTEPRTTYFGYVLPLEAALTFCVLEKWRAGTIHGRIGSVASNLAKLSDRDAVRAVLSGYCYYDEDLVFVIVEDKEGAGGTLEVRGKEWPMAVPQDLMPEDDDEDHPAGGEPEGDDPKQAVFHARGEQGFTELLQNLAPYLLAPLMVQAVLFIRNRSPILAREWRVEPGMQAIEVNSFKYVEAIAAEHSAR